MIKLAILIPTTPDRADLLERLMSELYRQCEEIGAITATKSYVMVLPYNTPPHNKETNEFSTGAKRNFLIQQAIEKDAEYVAFIDSDDMPGPTYIKRGLQVADSGMDCGELWGQIWFSGKPGNPFHHFIDCQNPATGKIEWWQDEKYYYRMINHLNFQKLSLVKDIPFPEQVFGEDGKQSEAMRDAGIFKTMYPIPEIIYHYYVGNPKHAI
jgi:hypothetical protein